MTTPKTIKPTKLKTDLKKQTNPNIDASWELEHDYRAQGAFVRSRAKWIEGGEKNSCKFSSNNLEKADSKGIWFQVEW